MSWRALIGLGSNIDSERHMTQAAQELRQRFPDVCFSSVYCSAAVGMEAGAADFLNGCALLTSPLAAADLVVWMKGLEDAHGRDRSRGSWHPRTLDLDLMWFDGVWLEPVMDYAHCYLPAAELLTLPDPQPIAVQWIERTVVQL
ncbi:MAG: 2-amino-4-hydroxy-6-hydroxymethyldihydropteridine diphosphokinase [Mariprofundales bacterium]